MVDHGTYHKMNKEATALIFDQPECVYSHDAMPTYLNPDDHPSEEILSLLPPAIYGFDLSEKEWIHLRLDSIHPVSWKKVAYDRLALPDHSKDLLRTLVLAQKSQCSVGHGIGVARARTDIVGGRGNELTVLLHGGSGTGKTLTAESMAEIAEMPLYRVTCGDIGADADAVEKDLAFILRFGKAWNCVLLLEEAHIFLTARPTSEPKKNSLTSSLLRILDYYNGIVILTSSHMAVFDGAIISRIRVSLHFESLNQDFRKKIWLNFIDSLEEDGVNANFEEIGLHVDDLAAKELNGHQIRNVFKTAKDLSMFRSQRLDWVHLVQALSLSSGFTTT